MCFFQVISNRICFCASGSFYLLAFLRLLAASPRGVHGKVCFWLGLLSFIGFLLGFCWVCLALRVFERCFFVLFLGVT